MSRNQQILIFTLVENYLKVKEDNYIKLAMHYFTLKVKVGSRIDQLMHQSGTTYSKLRVFNLLDSSYNSYNQAEIRTLQLIKETQELRSIINQIINYE